jgi:hypothetical protein
MDLKSTQLKDTYGNLLTIGTTEGSPTSGTLQNGDGEDISILTIGNSTSTNHRLILQDSTTSARILISSGDFFIDADVDGGNNRDMIFRVDGGDESMRLESNGDISFQDTSNNEAFYWDASEARLGIGTDSPDSLLQTELSTDGYQIIAKKSTNNAQIRIGIQNDIGVLESGNGSASLAFRVNNDEKMRIDSGGDISFRDGSASEAFYWDASAGSLGIGTAPDTKLHVFSTSAAPAKIITSSITNSSLLIGNTSTGTAVLNLDGSNGDASGADYFTIVQNNDLTANIYTQANAGVLTLGSKGTLNAMTIDGGNVGIGTDAPLAPLNIGVDSATASPIRAIKLGAGTSVVGNGQYIQFSTSTVDSLGSQIQGVRAGAGASSDLRFLTTNTSSVVSEKMRIDSSGNVGIGTDSPNVAGFPSTTLTIEGNSGNYGAFEIGSANATSAGQRLGEIRFYNKAVSAPYGISSIRSIRGTNTSDSELSFWTSLSNVATERMRIDSSGNVGIGTDSPDTILELDGGSSYEHLKISSSSNTSRFMKIGMDSAIEHTIEASGSQCFLTFKTGATPTEKMRIDSSGNVLVGKDTNTYNSVGSALGANGASNFTRDGDPPVGMNRLTSDGKILSFAKDGTEVGSIGTYFGDLYIASPSSTDAGIGIGASKINPTTTTGALRDNAIDLGQSAGRWKDLYLGGTSYVEQYSAPSTPTIADDAFYTLTPQETIGFLLLGGRNDSYDNINGLFSYRVTANIYCTLMSRDNTSVETAEVSGAPTITDYTDEKVTVVVSDNGNIYIANRKGASISINLILFGQ